jgi:hypothetical protein
MVLRSRQRSEHAENTLDHLSEFACLRHTGDAFYDLPVPPDDERLREKSDAAVRLRDRVVSFRDRVVDPFQFRESRDQVFAAIVHRDADDLEAIGMMLTVLRNETRNLDFAAGAPRRPEVEQHDAATKIREMNRLAIE